jgi:hypothetical protein
MGNRHGKRFLLIGRMRKAQETGVTFELSGKGWGKDKGKAQTRACSHAKRVPLPQAVLHHLDADSQATPHYSTYI